MNALLLRLLGTPVGESGTVVATRLELHPVFGPLTLLGLLLPLLGIVVWSYRMREVELSPLRGGVLLALRVLAILGLAGVLWRPALGLTVDGLVRQTLILLFDQSASLGLRDPRTEGADQVRAAIALGQVPAAGGLVRQAPSTVAPAPSRLDLLRAAVTNRELDLLGRLGGTFDLKFAAFAGDLQALDPGTAEAQADPGAATSPNRSANPRSPPPMAPAQLAAALRADGPRSAPGTAVRELLVRERGRPLGGIVMFTDGIRNAGVDLSEVASLVREASLPVHAVGLGTTSPRDVQVVELLAPDVAFVRDEVAVNARLRARGLAGQSLRVSLSLDGQLAEARDVSFEADGETLVPLKFTPNATGVFELEASVPARPDEILAENNRQIRQLRVIDDRIRVLLLEQSPRWEFRYLQALLLRDRRVDLKCVLFDGDPAIARSPGSPYLDAFATRREDLFAYDLVVFGDVDPKNFAPSQLEILAEFVARSGGSFLMLAGRRFSPWGYRDTAIDRLLPVEFERPAGAPTAATAAAEMHDRPRKLALTAAGRASPLLRLADDPEENLRRWDALPPLFWVAPVERAKPAAQVLVTDVSLPDPSVPIPVIALQQYGVGQSMFIGTDNIWRWRRNEGERFFVSFWARVVQRLAIQHLLTGSRRAQLALDRVSALPGERIGITGRLFNNAFEPLIEPAVRARVEREQRGADTVPAAELLLRAVPDQPGVFRGEWLATTPGRYRVTVGDEAPAAIDFTVEDRLVEAGETALQEMALREFATATGGQSFREEDLHRLPDAVRNQAQRVQSRRVVELWSSPLYFLGVLGLLTSEWLLRKFWRLK